MESTRQLRDEWLALRCQGGDALAFRELVTELESPLLYFALKVCGNYEAAKDVVQDAWGKAARTIHKLERPAAIRSWLYRIVHGIAVDAVRRDLARERAEEGEHVFLETDDEPRLAAERAEAVHAALDQLSAPHREVLVLRFLEDFSLTEISQIVRCSEGTVKSRLHYAKAALRTILENDHHESESNRTGAGAARPAS